MNTQRTSIPRACTHRPAGQWPTDKVEGSLTLDFDERHRRRIRLTSDDGQDLLLDLPKTIAMADGDGLQLDDGRWVRIKAKAEMLVEVRHRDPHQLLRLAWHLGNRHLPTEIRDQVLRIRPDHVIEEMLLGFGADLVREQVAFQPEGGAYGGHNHHRHDVHSQNHGDYHDHHDGGGHHHHD
jgi:urease accessory protein